MRVAIGFLAVLACLAFLARPSSAQFEGAVWDTLTSDTLQDGLSHQGLASAQYQLHLAYGKIRPGAGWAVHYRFYDMLSGWAPERVVESSLPCSRPVIGARWVNGLRTAILFEANGDIYGTVFDDPFEPFVVVNVTNSSETEMFPTVAIDEWGFPHAAWITQIGLQYKIAYCVDNTDSLFIDIIENSQLGQFGSGAQPFIVVTGMIPHIFYRGVGGPAYRIHHAYPTWPDTVWAIDYLSTDNADDYTASAVVDSAGDIHLAISGNDGWGMPGHIYYLRRDHQTGEWIAPELVSGGNSVADGSIGMTQNGSVYLASCGVSGNFYTGDIFLSDNSQGSFRTRLLTTYQDGMQPQLTFLSGQYGAMALQGIIGPYQLSSYEIVYYGPAASGSDDSDALPRTTRLSYNYPNPFNSATIITVHGDIPRDVQLGIYDLVGRRVRTISGNEGSGEVRCFVWDGKSDGGLACPSGVYFYRLDGGERGLSGRMVMLK